MRLRGECSCLAFTTTSSLEDVSLHRLILLSSSRRVSPKILEGLSLPHSASRSDFALVFEQCVAVSCDLVQKSETRAIGIFSTTVRRKQV